VPALERIKYLGQDLARWNVGPSTFVAAPELGARLMHWSLNLPDGSLREVLHWPEVQTLDDIAKVRGGNPILFPFNARTFDQGDIHFWRDTTGQRRPMPMHGIARQSRFEIRRIHDAGFSAALIPGPAEQEAYPYKYEFLVSYRFGPATLAVELSLRNFDRLPIPWSAGHHFYFTLPWHDGLRRADYAIEIPAGKAVRHLADGRLSAPEDYLTTTGCGSPELVDRIHYGLQGNTIRFGPRQGGDSVSIRIGSTPVPPEWMTLVTWTYDDRAPYYCVEPWMGPPNSPENKIGYHLVKPNQVQTFVVEIDVA
jgi:galactose mutarotase-like enzyme